MRSALADRARTRRAVGSPGLIALALIVLLALSACSGNTSIAPPTASGDDSTARAAGASVAVAALESALRDHDAAAATALGAGAGRALLAAAVKNVSTLDLVDLSLRFVEDRSAVSSPTISQDGAWRGTVEVSYRLRDWDRAPTTDQTTFVFAPGGRGEQVVGIGDDQGRTPLWLEGPVSTLAHGRTLVVTRAGSPVRYSRLARRAVVDVGKVLPGWHGPLVIEVPASEQELDRALGAPPTHYSNIAAVTASVDGSLVRTAPVHVFLNPGVFDPLGPRGAQVVVSHESTHVATRATFASMPTWLLEGFADYVALAHAGIPVSVAASQILKEVRASGPPKHLPTTDDLAPTAPGLGATYEEAWLATRFIAVSYGEGRLVAFYDAVDGGQKVDQAFRRVLGTTQTSFVKRWSANTRALGRSARLKP